MSAHPVSNFPEAEFRFSRAARRCSCSSSSKRYSCSSTQLPRSHSHCCSTDQAHGQWDFLPFTPYAFFITFGVYRDTWSRDGFSAASALRPSEQVLLVLNLTEEAEPPAAARVRARVSVIRVRVRHPRVRIRIVVRPTKHTAATTIR